MAIQRIQIVSGVEQFFQEHRRGRCRMLALTYEFDPAAFERTFSAILRRPIQLDVVAGKECEGSTTRARFWRARWPGTFHLTSHVLDSCIPLRMVTLAFFGRLLEVKPVAKQYDGIVRFERLQRTEFESKWDEVRKRRGASQGALFQSSLEGELMLDPVSK